MIVHWIVDGVRIDGGGHYRSSLANSHGRTLSK